jgi:hypothetical protein
LLIITRPRACSDWPFGEQNVGVEKSDQSPNTVQPAQRDELVTRNAEPVTRATSGLAFRVTDANQLLAAIWHDW